MANQSTQLRAVSSGIRWGIKLPIFLLTLLASVQIHAGVDLFEHQPESIHSENGVLNADLVVKYADVTLNDKVVRLRTYNGTLFGPSFVIQPGDVMKIRNLNRLPENHDGDHAETEADGYVAPHGFNTINLHTHGLNVDPEGNSDNVLLLIEPGYFVPFEFAIPDDHPTGLFWYHPHRHGATAVHLGSAMAGNIIITGDGDLGAIPEIAAAKELEMIFSEIPLAQVDDHYEVPDQPLDIFNAVTEIFSINGLAVHEIERVSPFGAPWTAAKKQQELPEIRISPGEVQRWKMTHAGIDQFLNLTIVSEDESGGDTIPLHMVAYDGITLPEVDTEDAIFIAAANRAEFLVQGPSSPGRYIFKSIPNEHQDPLEIPLAVVIVEGEPMDMALPNALNPPVDRLPDIADDEITRRRVISFDVVDGPRSPVPDFKVNNRFFDGDRVDQTMFLDTAEEWVLTTDLRMSHPFHIHVNWFQVTQINGVDVEPRWQDTVAIPKGGTVTIRHRFQRFSGKIVLHCHILAHEDLGMMALLEIIDPKNLNHVQSWRQAQFERPINQFEGGNLADPDGDFKSNYFHFAFNISPYSLPPYTSSTSGLLELSTVSIDGSDYQGFDFDRVSGAESEVEYMLQSSDDLHEWTNVPYETVGDPTDLGNGYERVSIRDLRPLPLGPSPEAPSRFLRVSAAPWEYQPQLITPDLPQ
jgi:FtsP/CotA-like multicopper oxidase with cupredoxin domain